MTKKHQTVIVYDMGTLMRTTQIRYDVKEFFSVYNAERYINDRCAVDMDIQGKLTQIKKAWVVPHDAPKYELICGL